MVQPSKRFDVWRRLYARFKIEPFPATGEGPGVSTTITPITDADVLLRVAVFGGGTINLSASAGNKILVQSVPEGKVWIVKGVFRPTTVANSSLILRSGGAGLTISALDTAELFVPIPNIRLAESGGIGMLTTGNAGDNVVEMLTAYEEEDVF